MSNKNLKLIWYYHDATKHSYESIRSDRHYLDWSNHPQPFKIYSDLEPIPLPRDWPTSHVDALTDASSVAPHEPKVSTPDLKTLASILFHTAGITRRRTYPGGEILFRAAACTGALYEIELYLVCGPLLGLEAGVYHFNPADFSLRMLRKGDWRPLLVRATANEPSTNQPPITIVCTGTYWRNAWKYQARTYRHFFWDNGTMLANLFAITSALHIPARLVMGFVDQDLNQLLGLDTQREVAISLIPLGRENSEKDELSQPSPLNYRIAAYSKSEVDYPLMRQVHEASSLSNSDEVKEWQDQAPVFWEPHVAKPRDEAIDRWEGEGGSAQENLATAQQGTRDKINQVIELTKRLRADFPFESIEQVILRRGSTRQFARLSIHFDQLSTLLACATQGIPVDFLQKSGTRLNELYLIINAVEGLPSGAYYLRRDEPCLQLLKKGSFRQEAGHLGLDQALPADASVAVFFLADLKEILEVFGNRGYRAAQIEAGIIGGKIYLAAYAQRLGATGLTFFDDEVTDFFSPHAAGKSAIFLTAVGLRAKSHLQVQ